MRANWRFAPARRPQQLKFPEGWWWWWFLEIAKSFSNDKFPVSLAPDTGQYTYQGMASDSDYESDLESFDDEEPDLYCLQLDCVVVQYQEVDPFSPVEFAKFHYSCLPRSYVYKLEHRITCAVDQYLHCEPHPKFSSCHYCGLNLHYVAQWKSCDTCGKVYDLMKKLP